MPDWSCNGCRIINPMTYYLDRHPRDVPEGRRPRRVVAADGGACDPRRRASRDQRSPIPQVARLKRACISGPGRAMGGPRVRERAPSVPVPSRAKGRSMIRSVRWFGAAMIAMALASAADAQTPMTPTPRLPRFMRAPGITSITWRGRSPRAARSQSTRALSRRRRG